MGNKRIVIEINAGWEIFALSLIRIRLNFVTVILPSHCLLFLIFNADELIMLVLMPKICNKTM